MPTGYEVGMYNNIEQIRRDLHQLATIAERIATSLEALVESADRLAEIEKVKP